LNIFELRNLRGFLKSKISAQRRKFLSNEPSQGLNQKDIVLAQAPSHSTRGQLA
jgi:hypothetical protein